MSFDNELHTLLLRLSPHGGVVSVAKFSDVSVWQSHAKECGRDDSIVQCDENMGFACLDYELEVHEAPTPGGDDEELCK